MVGIDKVGAAAVKRGVMNESCSPEPPDIPAVGSRRRVGGSGGGKRRWTKEVTAAAMTVWRRRKNRRRETR